MAIESVYTSTGSLLGLNINGNSATTGEAGERTRASSGGSASLRSQIQDRINEILADVPRSGSKLSFDDVLAYRDQLKEELETTVREDMEKLGVDVDTDIQLAYDSASGQVVCTNDHPDKDVINRYFQANPEVCEDYVTALQLSRLAEPAETQLSPTQLRAQLQAQTVSFWMAENSDASTFTGSLGSLMDGQGITAYAGVNLSV